jgi:hypothetical protein
MLAGLAIAWWKQREAHRTKQALNAALEAFPAGVAAALDTVLESSQEDVPTSAALPVVNYQDVNADGKRELLVQYPAGAHGSGLRIFGWKDGEFRQLARLGVGTPVGFEYGDFDGDGNIEIRTEEIDWSANLPYVSSPRVVLLIRWNGTDFVEVSRKPS